MDLGEIIEATKEITFEFLGEKNTAEVYIAGISRLTAQQAQALRDGGEMALVQDSIPLLVKSWDVMWKGEPLEIDSLLNKTESGGYRFPLPVAFASALFEEAEKVMYGRPTIASESPAGLQQMENVPEETAIQ